MGFFKSLWISLLVVSCAMMLNCSSISQELTRSRAASLIKASKVIEKKELRGVFYTRGANYDTPEANPKDLRNFLIKLGYVELVDPKPIYGNTTLFKDAYALTSKGASVARDWQELAWTTAFSGKVLDRKYSPLLFVGELVEITGIQSQGNVAQVDITWRWIPTPLTAEIEKAGFKIDPDQVGLTSYGSIRYHPGVQKGSVAFRKYDDGWRLAGDK